jgi:hypothetical protein
LQTVDRHRLLLTGAAAKMQPKTLDDILISTTNFWSRQVVISSISVTRDPPQHVRTEYRSERPAKISSSSNRCLRHACSTSRPASVKACPSPMSKRLNQASSSSSTALWSTLQRSMIRTSGTATATRACVSFSRTEQKARIFCDPWRRNSTRTQTVDASRTRRRARYTAGRRLPQLSRARRDGLRGASMGQKPLICSRDCSAL